MSAERDARARLRKLEKDRPASLCDPECQGRCRICPANWADDIIEALRAALAALDPHAPPDWFALLLADLRRIETLYSTDRIPHTMASQIETIFDYWLYGARDPIIDPPRPSGFPPAALDPPAPQERVMVWDGNHLVPVPQKAHVCGLQGYAPGPPQYDPICPACAMQEPKPGPSA